MTFDGWDLPEPEPQPEPDFPEPEPLPDFPEPEPEPVSDPVETLPVTDWQETDNDLPDVRDFPEIPTDEPPQELLPDNPDTPSDVDWQETDNDLPDVRDFPEIPTDEPLQELLPEQQLEALKFYEHTSDDLDTYYDEFEAFVSGVWDGVVDTPGQILDGTIRTLEMSNPFDSDRVGEIWEENKRAGSLILDAYENRETMGNLATILLEHYEQLPEEAQQHIEELAGVKAADIVGQLSGSGLSKEMTSQLTEKGLEKLTSRLAVSGTIASTGVATAGVGAAIGVLHFQGTLQEASEASRELRNSSPELYEALQENNLDMLYFLIQP